MEPDGTERSYSWPHVPFLGKKSCFDPSRILGLASKSLRTITFCARHATATACWRLVRNECPPPSTAVMSISIKQDFFGARSVGPFGSPMQRRGVPNVQHMFLPYLYRALLSRAEWNLFDVGSQSAPVSCKKMFHSVRSIAL